MCGTKYWIVILTCGTLPLWIFYHYAVHSEFNFTWKSTGTNVSVQLERQTLWAPNMTRILLVTYYRGGSSFLGQIFAQNQAVFYWFEPLEGFGDWKDSVVSYMSENGFQPMDNNSLRSSTGQVVSEKTWLVSKTLECAALSQQMMSGKFYHNGQGMPRLGTFRNCIKNTKNYSMCAGVLRETCLNSTIVVSKVIRYSMEEVRDLFRLQPDVKVIHYVRDPRAIIASRAKIHWWRGQFFTDRARLVCEKMARNHEIFLNLQREYPQNVMFLKYEDLALRPIEVAQDVYKFVGHMLPDNVSKWIENNTKVQGADWFFSTQRNSTDMVDRWRTASTGTNINTTTELCKDIIQDLGYDLKI